MKNKNLILALLALVLAVSTAFTTTTFLPEDAYVFVRLDNEDGPIECRDTGGQCDVDTGIYPCRVRYSSCVTCATNIVVPAKAGCAVPLWSLSTSDIPIVYSETIYESMDWIYMNN
jgi:hypothetical protein